MWILVPFTTGGAVSVVIKSLSPLIGTADAVVCGAVAPNKSSRHTQILLPIMSDSFTFIINGVRKANSRQAPFPDECSVPVHAVSEHLTAYGRLHSSCTCQIRSFLGRCGMSNAGPSDIGTR